MLLSLHLIFVYFFFFTRHAFCLPACFCLSSACPYTTIWQIVCLKTENIENTTLFFLSILLSLYGKIKTNQCTFRHRYKQDCNLFSFLIVALKIFIFVKFYKILKTKVYKKIYLYGILIN